MRTVVAAITVAIVLAGCDRQSKTDIGHVPAASSASTETAVQAASSGRHASQDTDATIATGLVKRFAATYDYDQLLGDPLVHQALHDLLGPELDHFKQNMSALRVPIDVVSGNLVLYGARNDLPIREQAVLCVSFHPLRVHVGFYSNNAMTVYSGTSKYEHLPEPILQWVFLATQGEGGIDRPPAQGNSEFTFEFKVVSKTASSGAVMPLTLRSSRLATASLSGPPFHSGPPFPAAARGSA